MRICRMLLSSNTPQDAPTARRPEACRMSAVRSLQKITYEVRTMDAWFQPCCTVLGSPGPLAALDH
jgi:hypothetical protein